MTAEYLRMALTLSSLSRQMTIIKDSAPQGTKCCGAKRRSCLSRVASDHELVIPAAGLPICL